tara:strand:- start:3366 stop:3689 length:324 start_codon:yes stop_codon:yes gene_type:complete
MDNHVWKIYDLERVIADNVVTKITYGCESKGNKAMARTVGNIEISGSVEDDNFIPYENLTEEIVLGWVTSLIDTSIFEAENSSTMEQQRSERAAFLAAKTTEVGTPW